MKIVICSSIDFTYEVKEVADKLEKAGHVVEIPLTSQRILRGEMTLEEFKKEKERDGDGFVRKVKEDLIRRYFEIIKNNDVVLVVNCRKNGVENYIGGNTFLEMGFAHVLRKKIFLLNPISELSYHDELVAMEPVVLDGDLEKIKD
jgi:diphthamide synthase subunit DPH2